MSKSQQKKCAKGLHTYKERQVKDLGGKSWKLLNCIYCNHQYQKPNLNKRIKI